MPSQTHGLSAGEGDHRFAERKVPVPRSKIRTDFGTFRRRRHITKARYQSVNAAFQRWEISTDVDHATVGATRGIEARSTVPRSWDRMVRLSVYNVTVDDPVDLALRVEESLQLLLIASQLRSHRPGVD